MKIGTVTFHCAYNFGSALQAYALKEYLTRLGHDVSVIDYRSPDFDLYKIIRLKNLTLKSLVGDLLFLPGNLRRRHAFQAFWKKYFNLTKCTYSGPEAERNLAKDLRNYDAFICGSDQIWNLDCTHGPVPPFFLSFAPERAKKIAYAPSLSHERFEEQNFSVKERQRVAEWLARLDAISVRELSVAGEFQKLTDRTIVETLDPTLLLDPNDYRHVQSSSLPKGLKPGKYVFAYTLWHNDDMNRYLDGLAKKRGLVIAYYSKKPIRYKCSSVNLWGIGPSDFLNLIDKADCVISNSFHATVFSIIYGKEFLTFDTIKSGSRMKTLLGKLGLPEQHLLPMQSGGLSDIEPFASILDKVRLGKMREDSERFLKDSLM